MTPADELVTLQEDVKMVSPSMPDEEFVEPTQEPDGLGLGITKSEPTHVETGLPTPEPSKIHSSPATPPMDPSLVAFHQELNSATPKAAPAVVVLNELAPPETPKAALADPPAELPEVPNTPLPTLAQPSTSAQAPAEAKASIEPLRMSKTSSTSSHRTSASVSVLPTTSSHVRSPSKSKNRISALGSLLGGNRSVLGLAGENGNGAELARSESKTSKKDRRKTLTLMSEPFGRYVKLSSHFFWSSHVTDIALP